MHLNLLMNKATKWSDKIKIIAAFAAKGLKIIQTKEATYRRSIK